MTLDLFISFYLGLFVLFYFGILFYLSTSVLTAHLEIEKS
jgi:hypothetical protein